MLHHEMDNEFCPGCEDKIAVAHSDLLSNYRLIKKEFPDCHVSWAFRDKKDQDAFFILGKTHEQWPHSKHNNMKDGLPLALALDLFQINSDNRAVFSPKFYYDVNSFCEKNNLPLEWSGTWKTFRELDHFQLKEETVI